MTKTYYGFIFVFKTVIISFHLTVLIISQTWAVSHTKAPVELIVMIVTIKTLSINEKILLLIL